MRAFFYDTWAFLALANRADPHHSLSARLDQALEDAGFVAVTSDYVLDETLTGLHVSAGSRTVLAFLDGIEARVAAAELMLVNVNPTRRGSALAVFRKLCPGLPRLSFTDCSSFAVMRELGIKLAFTADRHFHSAGYDIRPLLQWREGRLELAWSPH